MSYHVNIRAKEACESCTVSFKSISLIPQELNKEKLTVHSYSWIIIYIESKLQTI